MLYLLSVDFVKEIALDIADLSVVVAKFCGTGSRIEIGFFEYRRNCTTTGKASGFYSNIRLLLLDIPAANIAHCISK